MVLSVELFGGLDGLSLSRTAGTFREEDPELIREHSLAIVAGESIVSDRSFVV